MIQINRELQNRGATEQLTGRKQTWENPYYQQEPKIDPIYQSLKNLHKINTSVNQLRGYSDLTKGTALTGERQTIGSSAAGTAFDKLGNQQKWEANQQGALDVLMKLKEGGTELSDEGISMLANVGQKYMPMDQYNSNTQKNEKTEAGRLVRNINQMIGDAPVEVMRYKDALEKYEKSPNRKYKKFESLDANEIRANLISAAHEAINGTNDPKQKLKYWQQAYNSLGALNKAYPIEGKISDMLGDWRQYVSGGQAKSKGEYWIFMAGKKSYSVFIPEGTDRPDEFAANKIEKEEGHRPVFTSQRRAGTGQSTSETDLMRIDQTVEDKRAELLGKVSGEFWDSNKKKVAAKLMRENPDFKIIFNDDTGDISVVYTGKYRDRGEYVPKKNTMNAETYIEKMKQK